MRGEILTASGAYLNLEHPFQSEAIDIEVIAHALSNICRFGGHTSSFYSVAQHSVLVSEIVRPGLQLKALLHDAAEAYLGDVIKPLKVLLPEYARLERLVEEAIADKFGISSAYEAEIKKADMVLLATERRDLMVDQLVYWPLTGKVSPLSAVIAPLAPKQAKRQFLDRFVELTDSANTYQKAEVVNARH